MSSKTRRFEILRREDQLEQAIFTGMLTAVLRVPDLRVGDELELAFTTPTEDPTLRDDSFGVLLLGASPPQGRIRLGLSWEPGQEPLVKAPADLAPLARRSSSSLDITIDNAAPLVPPKDAPPRFSWPRMLEYSDFSSWEDVSSTFAPLYEQAASLSRDSALQEEIARIAETHSAPEERVQAALELVQEQVRYIYVGLAEGTDLKNWGFNSVFDTMIFGRLYYRMMERNSDRTIRMVRGSRVERPEITSATALKDNARIEDFDNSKANVYYDPENEMEPWAI